jgi:cell division protein FtsQ
MREQRDNTDKRSIGSPLLMIGLLSAVVVAAVWANLWKSDLRIADVRVSGNTIVNETDILSLASISKEQRLYGVDLLAAQRRIMQNAFIKSAAVNREAPNRISITIQERVPIAAVVLDKVEYLDADGVVLPPTRPENIFDVPVMTGAFHPGEFVPGRRITRSEVKEALEVLATAQQLGDELYRLISEAHVESGRDLVFYTAESGVPVVFGRGDVALKLVTFDGFWKDIVLHHGAHELVYVDLRFEDQVVVRWNHDEEEAQVTKALFEKSARAQKS